MKSAVTELECPRQTAARAPERLGHDHQHSQGANLNSTNVLPAPALQQHAPKVEPTNACSAQTCRKVLQKRVSTADPPQLGRLKANPRPDLRFMLKSRHAVGPEHFPG